MITRKAGHVLALSLACLGASASSASASKVDCWGSVNPTAGVQTDLTYAFQCSEPIKGYSIVSSLEVGEFGTDALVLDQAFQPVSGEAFTCEGDIPAKGFGCYGSAYDGHGTTSTFSIDSPRCVKRRNKLSVSLVAIDLDGHPTGPQGLTVPPRCAAAKPAKHRKRR